MMMNRPCNNEMTLHAREAAFKRRQQQLSGNNGTCIIGGPDFRGGGIGYRPFISTLDDDIPGLPVPGPADIDYNNIDPEMALPQVIGSRFSGNGNHGGENRINWSTAQQHADNPRLDNSRLDNPRLSNSSYQYSPEVQTAIESILFIADHIRKDDEENNVSMKARELES